MNPEFFLQCCIKKEGRLVYLCKPCLQQNYRGMCTDFNHPRQCSFCREFPYIKLIK